MPPVWVLFVVACALCGAYLLRPLITGAQVDDAPLRRLEEEKRGLLLALRDVDSDHASGKLSDADHARVRDRLESRAADVLEAIDRRSGSSSKSSLEERLQALREQSETKSHV